MRSCVALILIVFFGGTIAQPSLSAYSSQGIGDLRGLQLTNHIGKGGTGISYGSPWYLNNVNPALLPINNVTVFEGGIILESKKVSQNDITDQNGAGNLNYLALAFGVKPSKWTIGLGLMPYSSVNYSFNREEPIAGTTATVVINEKGTGGINRFYLSSGYKIHERLSFGIRASYLFGSIIKESSNRINDTSTTGIFSPAFFNRLSFKDFLLSAGLAYNQPLGDKLSLNLGVVIDNESKIKSKEFERIELRDGADVVIQVDTISDNVKGNIRLPRNLGFGIALNNKLKWNAGIDIWLQDWQDFENFNGTNDGLDRRILINLGGEVTPNINNLDNYLARITYRLGLSYEQTPYVFNGKNIDEFGINFGWSLPVSRVNSVNLGFQWGVRGETSDSLIREKFFRVLFGVTFNDRWFIRRKFD